MSKNRRRQKYKKSANKFKKKSNLSLIDFWWWKTKRKIGFDLNCSYSDQFNAHVSHSKRKKENNYHFQQGEKPETKWKTRRIIIIIKNKEKRNGKPIFCYSSWYLPVATDISDFPLNLSFVWACYSKTRYIWAIMFNHFIIFPLHSHSFHMFFFCSKFYVLL